MRIGLYRTSTGRNPVEDFIAGLSKADRTTFNDVHAGILELGFDFAGAEYRQLQGKLWEIKFQSQDGGYRIAYVMKEGDWMVWLHAFKKNSQKTSKGDLEIALRRMKEVQRWQP